MSDRLKVTRGRLPGAVLLHVGAIALAGWVGLGEPLLLLVAVPAVTLGVVSEGLRSRASAIACGFLIFGVVAVLAAERHLDRFAHEWPERSVAWEADVRNLLSDSLDELLRQGEVTAERVAGWWASEESPAGPLLPPGFRPPSVDALAVFGPAGELLAWAGEHQGPFPMEVREPGARYDYHESALFGYLYVTHPLPDGGGVAVAASLLRTDLPPVLTPPANDFESRFESRTGAEIEIVRADLVREEGVWELHRGDRSILSVVLTPAQEAEARGSLELGWGRAVALLVLLGWAFAVVGTRGVPLALVAGGASLPGILLLLPLGSLTAWARVFSPADVLLPGPLPLSLGDLLALGAGGALFMGLLPWGRVGSIPRLVAAVGGGLVALGVLHLLRLGASRDFLAGGEFGWIAFQGGATALVFLAFSMAVLVARRPRDEDAQPWSLVGALALAVIFGLSWALLVARVPTLPSWIALLWAIPLLGVMHGAPAGRGWTSGGLVWGCSAVLAASLALPWAWDLRVDARMSAAEERVERLGTRPDPFLEFLLLRTGEEAWERASAEYEPVEILYQAWTTSGLAWEGVPLWLTHWSEEGLPHEELRIGVSELRPEVPPTLHAEARERGEVVVRRLDLAEAHYIGVAPLPDGGSISMVVPPRRILAGASPLGPLFSPARSEPDPLVLINLFEGEVPGPTERIEWVPTRDGWQGEIYVTFPEETYHAHYFLELPGWFLLLARGTLLLLLSVTVLGALWAVGRWMGQGGPWRSFAWFGAVSSFRGRVTLALFAFFLIPSILFGTLAYRTLAGAAVRTAEALAERAVQDASTWYTEVDGAMDVLAQRVGSDLLLYENGELMGGSLRELVELGLYEGWLPPEIHRDMAGGEELMTTATSSLGGWEYVVAYRRLPGGQVLAAPAPLQAGATALRQRDVADLLGFAVVMGGFLSVLLALLVGRALSRPIQTLRVASERVGAGNMGVHLPDDRRDEFGAVFDAFNRMVDRLSRTRTALVRASERSRAIVEEVATGVVALDSDGRVTLVNPRAEDLLGVPLEVDRFLPEGEDPEDPRSVLVRWLDGYFRDGLREADTELSFGDRRIRVRARRISRQGPLGGAVVSLEDVTDELRTERILAWGEMAQQVAHEVKNPLTPIKLGVQHVRRAWEDGRPDFEEILRRNVDSILNEIERLATIASSFSRYAAPSPAGAEPLDAVDVAEVVEDMLELYSAGEGPVSFEFHGEEELPRVRSRPGELKEVLVNLLENARAALPEGGWVRIEARRPDEGGVSLLVRDNGTGVPPDLLPRIFEPHFSTRSSGTGLGLAIVRRLVESWGGDIDADSCPGEGTTIRVRFLEWDEEAELSEAGELTEVVAPHGSAKG